MDVVDQVLSAVFSFPIIFALGVGCLCYGISKEDRPRIVAGVLLLGGALLKLLA